MKIHSIYKFKLTDSANKTYRYSSKTNPYDGFEGIDELQLKPSCKKGYYELFELRINAINSARLVFSDRKYGFGFFENSNDLLIVKKSINKLGWLRIYVLKDMKPYLPIVYDQFLKGHFRPQIKSLRGSFVR